jgi:preprotein translocase subunit SecE
VDEDHHEVVIVISKEILSATVIVVALVFAMMLAYTFVYASLYSSRVILVDLEGD